MKYENNRGGSLQIEPVARVHSDFGSKFGIPRQAGIVKELGARVVFEPEFRNPDILRGLNEFSHIWLIWGFSENADREWHPTVRPPRLGGNKRLGVFATRSPFRPNPLGLSVVRLLEIEQTAATGQVLHIAGADIMDGTPVYDIKPYVPYSDIMADAAGGFASVSPDSVLEVFFPQELLEKIPEEKRVSLIKTLELDPRPSYHSTPGRVYGMEFGGMDVRFQIEGSVLTVVSVERRED